MLLLSVINASYRYDPVSSSLIGDTVSHDGYSVTSCRSQKAPSDGSDTSKLGGKWKLGLTRAGLVETTG